MARRFSGDLVIDVVYKTERYAGQTAGTRVYVYDCRVAIKDERRISFVVETEIKPVDEERSHIANIDAAACEALDLLTRAEMEAVRVLEAERIDPLIRVAALNAARDHERNVDGTRPWALRDEVVAIRNKRAARWGSRLIFRTKREEETYVTELAALLGGTEFVIYYGRWGWLVALPSEGAAAIWGRGSPEALRFKGLPAALDAAYKNWAANIIDEFEIKPAPVFND